MATESMGTFRGVISLEVKQALDAYTKLRQEHVSTVVALNVGSGALIRAGEAIAGVGQSMVGSIIEAAKASGEFERQLDFFNAVAGTTADQLQAIKKEAL